MIPGIFEVKDKDLAGRLGLIYTKSGVIKVPTLFPVINPRRQDLPVNEVVEAGFDALITNAYLLKKYREREALERGVHGVLGFNGPIMTDSGAYQLLLYGDVEVSNRDIVVFQEDIGSDIAVILDVPTGGSASREEAERTVEETLRRAREAVEYRRRDDVVWVLPVQGGTYLDLLERCAREGVELPYHMVAIGSPTQLMERYDFESIIDMIATVKAVVPPSVPVHLFGAGHPMMLAFAVALGVDTFDSAAYALYAKDDRYMTHSGTYRLEELEELPCACPVCSRYTPRELKGERTLRRRMLISKHNLYATAAELRRIRQAIREGTLWELLEERSRAHPSLHRAFKRLCAYREYLERLDPEAKGSPQGLLLYDRLSLCRPEIMRHRRRLLANYSKAAEYREVVVVVGEEERPYTVSESYTSIKRRMKNIHVVFYVPFLGVVPEELAETYPNSQFEMGAGDELVVRDSMGALVSYLEAQGYVKIIILYKRGHAQTAKRIRRLVARRLNVPCTMISFESFNSHM